MFHCILSSDVKTALLIDRRLHPRRWAVFLQCGSGAVWGGWWQDGSRPFDLLINHYDSTYAGKIPCEVEFRQTGRLPGTKFTAFYSLIGQYPIGGSVHPSPAFS